MSTAFHPKPEIPISGAAPLSAALVPACAKMLSDAFSQPPWQSTYPPAETEAYLTKFITRPNCLALVWMEDGKPVALALGFFVPGLGQDYLRVEDFCAWPQKKGYGGKLLESLCQYAHQTGADSIILNTVRDFPAFDFYKKHHFLLLADSACLFRDLNKGESTE